MMKKMMNALLPALSLVLLLAACGGAPGQKDDAPQEPVDLNAFYEEQIQDGEWPAMALAEGEMLEGLYPGLSDLDLKQCVVSMAQISAAVGEIALVEASDAEGAKAAEELFQARIDYQVSDSSNPGGAWYPESIEGWKKNSRIVTNGNYVMMVAGENAESVVEAFNALFA